MLHTPSRNIEEMKQYCDEIKCPNAKIAISMYHDNIFSTKFSLFIQHIFLHKFV